jgi:hypothetical protein
MNDQRRNGRKKISKYRAQHSANFFYIFPSAPIKSTRQSPFAEKNFAERTLPTATLGKAAASSSVSFSSQFCL